MRDLTKEQLDCIDKLNAIMLEAVRLDIMFIHDEQSGVYAINGTDVEEIVCRDEHDPDNELEVRSDELTWGMCRDIASVNPFYYDSGYDHYCAVRYSR